MNNPIFRTIVQPIRSSEIARDARITMLGSCFTDNIGSRLKADGFDVSVNPLGVLFNPFSIATVVERAQSGVPYSADDLIERDNVWHCLDFESRRQNADASVLLRTLNEDFEAFADRLSNTDVLIVTFGTAWIFEYGEDNRTAGNCHKLHPGMFRRRRLSVEEIVSRWKPLCDNRRVIFTVSPVRHLADGLHGNSLSKATLLLATEQLGEYFPSYEAVNDDLRDYRFYDADMKHPSSVAVDYIYSLFADTYFSKETQGLAHEAHREFLRSQHRPIL